MLFLTRLQDNCRTYNDKLAIEYLLPEGAERVRYGELETAVQQTMAYLQALGVQPGDRVALQLPKCLPFVYLHLAIMRLGAITLPLNPGYPETELVYSPGAISALARTLDRCAAAPGCRACGHRRAGSRICNLR